jgi:cell shape-determining protein MreC
MVLQPILKIGHNIGINITNTRSFFVSKHVLQTENQNLKNELDEARATSSNYNSVLDENSKLKEVLERKDPNTSLILASILSKPNKTPYDTLMIDAGEKEGVSLGALVLALGNIPIGNVSAVYPNSSTVVLFSTSGEKTDIIVGGRDAYMQIVGRGGGNFEMVLPRDFELEEGAEVTLPGITSHLVAKVVTILSDPRDAYKKALLRSLVNTQELQFVQIEKQ